MKGDIEIVKTICREAKRVHGARTLYGNKKGFFQLSRKAAEEFMLNEKNYGDYGFLLHVDSFENVFIERVLVHKEPKCFRLGISKTGFIIFYSVSALKYLSKK